MFYHDVRRKLVDSNQSSGVPGGAVSRAPLLMVLLPGGAASGIPLPKVIMLGAGPDNVGRCGTVKHVESIR